MILRLPLPPCQIHLADIPQEHRSDDNSSHSKPLLLQSPPPTPTPPPPQAAPAPQLGSSLKAHDFPFLSGIRQHFPASGHLPQEFFSLEVTPPRTQLSETVHPSLKTQFTLFPARTQGYPSLVCKDRPLLIDCGRLGDWDLWFLPKSLTLFWSLLTDDSQNVLSLSSWLPFTFSVTPSLFSSTVPAGPCIFQGLWGLQGRAILMTS